METISLSSSERCQIIDITAQVQQIVRESQYQSGIVLVYSPHTTAGITVNENADPSVKHDFIRSLGALVPEHSGFDHAEGNSDAHIKGSLINFSQSFIIENGHVVLGTWQGIYFVEWDGPRHRQVHIKIISD